SLRRLSMSPMKSRSAGSSAFFVAMRATIAASAAPSAPAYAAALPPPGTGASDASASPNSRSVRSTSRCDMGKRVYVLASAHKFRRESLSSREAEGTARRRLGNRRRPAAVPHPARSGKDERSQDQMKTTVVGAYPKNSDDRQDLRRALHKLDRDELDVAGIDGVYDAQIRWDDLLAPLAAAWGNVERGPLERFYDNNTYFRQPIISGAIESDGQALVGPYKSAKGVAKRELKAAMC